MDIFIYRNALDSPQRANLSEKDTNKTNTYTKDPTKDQLKKTSSSGGSPIKEVKNGSGNNNKTQGDGPIIFINNTYDLPPIIPINKGAIISDRRQRSRERSSSLNKENGSSECNFIKNLSLLRHLCHNAPNVIILFF